MRIPNDEPFVRNPGDHRRILRAVWGYSITEEMLHQNVSTMDGVGRGARRMPIPSTGFRVIRAAPPMVVRTGRIVESEGAACEN